jgi:hypothetical protein
MKKTKKNNQPTPPKNGTRCAYDHRGSQQQQQQQITKKQQSTVTIMRYHPFFTPRSTMTRLFQLAIPSLAGRVHPPPCTATTAETRRDHLRLAARASGRARARLAAVTTSSEEHIPPVPGGHNHNKVSIHASTPNIAGPDEGSGDSLSQLAPPLHGLPAGRRPVSASAVPSLVNRRTGGHGLPLAPPSGHVALAVAHFPDTAALWAAPAGPEAVDALEASLEMAAGCVTAAAREFGGFEVAGDGERWAFAFVQERDACLFAIAAQRRLRVLPYPSVLLESMPQCGVEYDSSGTGAVVARGIRIAIAVHGGYARLVEPERSDVAAAAQAGADELASAAWGSHGIDYVGRMVEEAGAIAAAANGGDIVLSGEVLDALAEDDEERSGGGGGGGGSASDEHDVAAHGDANTSGDELRGGLASIRADADAHGEDIVVADLGEHVLNLPVKRSVPDTMMAASLSKASSVSKLSKQLSNGVGAEDAGGGGGGGAGSGERTADGDVDDSGVSRRCSAPMRLHLLRALPPGTPAPDLQPLHTPTASLALAEAAAERAVAELATARSLFRKCVRKMRVEKPGGTSTGKSRSHSAEHARLAELCARAQIALRMAQHRLKREREIAIAAAAAAELPVPRAGRTDTLGPEIMAAATRQHTIGPLEALHLSMPVPALMEMAEMENIDVSEAIDGDVLGDGSR